MTDWVVLSTEWKLQDVQAGLNVVINITSFTFIFISAWLFCHRSTRRLAREEDVPISSLFTLTTPGEVLDVVRLLQTQLLAPAHLPIVLQCVVILVFSLTATFAGPIARYSTRAGETVRLRPVPGLQASRSLACDVNNNVRWQEVFTRLDKAAFPRNQLLDYLPDIRTDWVYESDEWNSIYLADCTVTPRTVINVEATGNFTNRFLWLYDEIPALWTMLSPRFRREDIIHDVWYDGVRNPEVGVWDNVVIWQYVDMSSSEVSHEQNASTQQTIISIGVLYMEDAPEYNLTVSNSTTDDWAFGEGPVPNAYYSKVECDIHRNRPEDNNLWEAYPQIRTNCDLAKQMDVYWSATTIVPADGTGENVTINLPTGEDMFRFYQSWMIAKDTYYPFPSTREISVTVTTVELSIPFIVVCGLVILLVVLGLLHFVYMKWRYRRIMHSIPGTKVDWVLQSIEESNAAGIIEGVQVQALGEGKEISARQLTARREKLWLSARYAAPHQGTARTFGRIQTAHQKIGREEPASGIPDDKLWEQEPITPASQVGLPVSTHTSTHLTDEQNPQPMVPKFTAVIRSSEA